MIVIFILPFNVIFCAGYYKLYKGDKNKISIPTPKRESVKLNNLYLSDKQLHNRDFLNYLYLSDNQEHIDRMLIKNGTLVNWYQAIGEFGKTLKSQFLYSSLENLLFNGISSLRKAEFESKFWNSLENKQQTLPDKERAQKEIKANQEIVEKQLLIGQRNALLIAIVLILVLSILGYINVLHRCKNKLIQQVTALELRAIKAQMNPHFMFNSLSVIQTLINKGELKLANGALNKFGNLMRLILENSEKQSVLLEEEIKTLRLYIELESLRFPFNYSIEVDENINIKQMIIPSMVIQPYVENAIKHGFSEKKDNRNLKILFKKEKDQLFCVVEDDGIGRNLSEGRKSKYLENLIYGRKLSTEKLLLATKANSGKAKVEIKDLFLEDGRPSGTRVELGIPVKSLIIQ